MMSRSDTRARDQGTGRGLAQPVNAVLLRQSGLVARLAERMNALSFRATLEWLGLSQAETARLLGIKSPVTVFR